MKLNGLCLSSLLLVCSLNKPVCSILDEKKCLNFEPVSDFDTNEFTGRWYGVETSIKYSDCFINEFSNNIKPSNGTGERSGSSIDKNDPNSPYLYHLFGTLKADPELPSTMKTYVIGTEGKYEASFVVFDTDYHNYAAVYSCQEIKGGVDHTVTILSRTYELEGSIIEKVKAYVRLAGYPIEQLKKVNHSGCNHPQEIKNPEKNLYSYVSFQTKDRITDFLIPTWVL